MRGIVRRLLCSGVPFHKRVYPMREMQPGVPFPTDPQGNPMPYTDESIPEDLQPTEEELEGYVEQEEDPESEEDLSEWEEEQVDESWEQQLENLNGGAFPKPMTDIDPKDFTEEYITECLERASKFDKL